MKIKNLIVTAAAASAMLLAGCNKQSGDSGMKIKVWVSETEGVADLFKQQIKAFAKEYGVKINAKIQGVSEGQAAAEMLKDVDAGADIFCFAQDQLARLVQGGAIGQLGQAASEYVITNNDAGSVSAVTFGTGEDEKLYAYPMTSDNGLFMFYDKSAVSETQAQTLEGIMSACQTTGKKISWKLNDIWHSAGFFFGAGCTSTWETDDDGNFISVTDDFNSDKGFAAAKAMRTLLNSDVYAGAYGGAADFDAAIPSAVVISGTWDTKTAKDILGNDFAAAKLPTYTVDGHTYQTGSFSGFKLMGVKPQTDPERSGILHKLAQYLTGAECSEQRFDQFGWGPSNKAVQQMEKVQKDEALAAFFAQSPYSIPQGNIHGDWWSIGNAIATNLQGTTTDQGIWDALTTYDDAIHAVFDVKEVYYGICGQYHVGETAYNWGTPEDVRLDVTDNSNLLRTSVAITFTAEDTQGWKVRQSDGWANNWGKDGVPGGDNYEPVVGTFYVEFDLTTHIATLVEA